jgi:8-oxo-dGTP diphosphatase
MNSKRFALSVKVVIRRENGDCLLLRRSPASKNNAGKWEFPGGKVDPGECFDEALLREVAEETGLVISLQRVAGAGQSETPVRMIAYLFMDGRLESGTLRLSSEHDAHLWVPRAQLGLQDFAPHFLPFARRYAQGGD